MIFGIVTFFQRGLSIQTINLGHLAGIAAAFMFYMRAQALELANDQERLDIAMAAIESEVNPELIERLVNLILSSQPRGPERPLHLISPPLYIEPFSLTLALAPHAMDYSWEDVRNLQGHDKRFVELLQNNVS